MTIATFRIVYDGPALAENAMEVRDLAPALLALADTIEQANRALNDERTTVSVQVHGSFKSGSFGIDFDVVQSVAQQLVGLFADDKRVLASVNILALLGFAGTLTVGGYKGLVHVLKWLRGRKISRVEIMGDDGPARIVVDDESIEVEQATITLLRSYTVRQSLEKVIREPLDRDGVETVAFVYEEKVTEIIEKSERRYFAAPTDEDADIDDRTIPMTLQIVNVPMRDGYVWRFDDGTGPFSAKVTDESFLHRFHSNEVPFTPGDILRAEVRRRQFMVEGRLRTESEVTKVIQHESAYRQLPLEIVRRDDK